MNIYNFFLQYWDVILLVLAAIVFFAVLMLLNKRKLLNQILFALVTEAERQFGSGTGALKKAAVIAWFYEKLPTVIRFIISEKMISDWVEKVLDYAKEQWATNANIKNYIETKPVVLSNNNTNTNSSASVDSEVKLL